MCRLSVQENLVDSGCTWSRYRDHPVENQTGKSILQREGRRVECVQKTRNGTAKGRCMSVPLGCRLLFDGKVWSGCESHLHACIFQPRYDPGRGTSSIVAPTTANGMHLREKYKPGTFTQTFTRDCTSSVRTQVREDGCGTFQIHPVHVRTCMQRLPHPHAPERVPMPCTNRVLWPTPIVPFWSVPAAPSRSRSC